MESNCGGCLSGAIVSCREYGGRMQYAPTRTSDNGRGRSFASEMVSNCGGYPIGAIVLGHEHGGRMQYAPTRTSDNGRCRSFAPVGNHFTGASRPHAVVPCSNRLGAYAIRPYTDVRQWLLTFVRPQDVFRLRRMPVGRYCSLPGTSGAYAFAPLHGCPTMADDVRWPPKWFPTAADTR